jgi:hypothetical protein
MISLNFIMKCKLETVKNKLNYFHFQTAAVKVAAFLLL